MDNEDAIKQEFLAGELEAIAAIQRLEGMGYPPKEAEKIVDEWQEDEMGGKEC